MHVSLLLLLTVAGLTVTSSAIKCYSCESVYEKNCAENFEEENHFKLDCAHIAPPRYLEDDLEFPNSTACMKRIYKEHGVQKIVRSCFFGEINDTDTGCRMDPSMMSVQEMGCYVCNDEDYCNTSTAYRSNLFLISVITVVLTAFRVPI